jgi:hypothetical protein
MGATRVKFSSKADAKLLAEMRKIARDEGRQLQALLDEAMRDYLGKKHSSKARPQVRKAFAESLRDFDALYRELAK